MNPDEMNDVEALNDTGHTATHEAGHAVVGRVLTLLCGGASIVPDYEAGEAGHAITKDPSECEGEWLRRGKIRHDNAVWHARIMTFMAGAEAEVMLLGAAQGGDGDDRYQIELMAENVVCADWNRLEARLRAMTRMLIRRHRDRIERVAAALLVKRKLSAKQVDSLTGRSINDLPEVSLGFRRSAMKKSKAKESTMACSVPGCSRPVLVKDENDQWLCQQHIQERINLPHNIALAQADEDLESFRDEGGKPS
jgi:hypothetical protein